MLTEKLPQPEFQFPYYSDTEKLLTALHSAYPVLEGSKFSLAVDKKVVQEKTRLTGNEEIALLPPFSGG